MEEYTEGGAADDIAAATPISSGPLKGALESVD